MSAIFLSFQLFVNHPNIYFTFCLCLYIHPLPAHTYSSLPPSSLTLLSYICTVAFKFIFLIYLKTVLFFALLKTEILKISVLVDLVLTTGAD